MDLVRELSRQGAQGRARGSGSACVDQIGDGLGLNQVEFVVEKRPLRELARLGNARTQFKAARQQHLQHDRATMPPGVRAHPRQ
jgi:hypothetical protein